MDSCNRKYDEEEQKFDKGTKGKRKRYTKINAKNRIRDTRY